MSNTNEQKNNAFDISDGAGIPQIRAIVLYITPAHIWDFKLVTIWFGDRFWLWPLTRIIPLDVPLDIEKKCAWLIWRIRNPMDACNSALSHSSSDMKFHTRQFFPFGCRICNSENSIWNSENSICTMCVLKHSICTMCVFKWWSYTHNRSSGHLALQV